jgi:hypothetical protein
MNISRCSCRLVAVIFVTLTLCVNAQAYSDEAVKNAEALVARTAKRFDAGNATRKEVALAQYNLLEMRYLAKAITHPTLCRLAKPNFEIISASLDDKEKGLINQKKWNDAITVMQVSLPNCQLATTIIDTIMFQETPLAHSDAAVREAKQLVATMINRFTAGDATARDVAAAKPICSKRNTSQGKFHAAPIASRA